MTNQQTPLSRRLLRVKPPTSWTGKYLQHRRQEQKQNKKYRGKRSSGEERGATCVLPGMRCVGFRMGYHSFLSCHLVSFHFFSVWVREYTSFLHPCIPVCLLLFNFFLIVLSSLFFSFLFPMLTAWCVRLRMIYDTLVFIAVGIACPLTLLFSQCESLLYEYLPRGL